MFSSDPQAVNRDNNDCRLRSSSAAVDARALLAEVRNDFETSERQHAGNDRIDFRKCELLVRYPGEEASENVSGMEPPCAADWSGWFTPRHFQAEL